MMKLILPLVAFMLATPGVAANRPPIRSQTDLPPTRFPFAQAPSAIMADPRLIAMLPALRQEAEHILRDYDVQDSEVRSELVTGLASIAILEDRKADADRLIAEFRSTQTKPQLKLIGRLTTDLAAAQLGVPETEQCSAAARRLTTLMTGTDPLVVRDVFVSSFGSLQLASVPYFASGVAADLDPVVKQRGSLDIVQALMIVRVRVLATMLPRCRSELVTAGRVWLDAPANRPVDIWPDRQPQPTIFAKAAPVVVAVWDAGYDPTLFPGQLARDPIEPRRQGEDAAGLADDWNGPTYDVRLQPRHGAITPPTRFLRARLAAQNAFDKGQLDVRYGFDTPEAALFAERARTAGIAEQTDDLLAAEENGSRSHGTACASEIADGAPYVRLYNVAALPWAVGEDKLSVPYDEATIKRWAAAIDHIGPRIRAANVRIVSMSWGFTADEITQQLLDRGLETDAAKAKTRGIAMQATIRDRLQELMMSSPNVLFVIAAGNSDQTDDVQADVTQKFALPNLLHVGATATNGRPTAFTVFGPSVDIYAQGEAVALRWPGDIAAHESGTSMAAPLVARAAAQMLALKPTLTAAEVRQGLLATTTAGQDGLRLLHPAGASAWAQMDRR